MDNQQHDWNSEWEGYEPGSARSRSWGCWFGVILLALILLVVCAAGVFFAWQSLELPLQPGTLLTPPTIVPGMEATADEAEAPISNTPSFAPTVTLSAQGGVADVEVTQLSFEPVLDGNLQEWQIVPTYESRYQVYQETGWDGTDDLNASWQLGWDATTLYIAVAVEDDTHVQTQTGNQIFKGDSVSLQLDTNRELDFGPLLNSDDFQINLSPGDFAGIPPSAFRFRGTSNGRSADAPGHLIAVAAQQTGQGYTLEAAIPWQDISVNPSPGLVLGVALNANDNDSPNTAVQEIMKSHVASREFGDPTSWGTLTLR
ncbi:MAG: sugar-binding protein [Candidatus Promineifilaceae bacterium]|nr:sugar-binding protein [Candidatus Promineifilaceae bacterium]